MSHFERPVRDYMTAPVHTVTVSDDLVETERRLTEHRISCVAVVGRGGEMAGVISHTDILQVGHVLGRHFGGETTLKLPVSCAGDLMTSRVISVKPDDTVAEAARRMVERRVHRLFVVEDERPIGVLSWRDLLRVVIDEKVAQPVSSFMSSPVITVPMGEPLSRAVEQLVKTPVRGLVVEDAGLAVGLFTQVEAVAARDLVPSTPVGEAIGWSLIQLPAALPLWRAAAFAAATRARRVLVTEAGVMKGILTGIDFARAAVPDKAA